MSSLFRIIFSRSIGRRLVLWRSAPCTCQGRRYMSSSTMDEFRKKLARTSTTRLLDFMENDPVELDQLEPDDYSAALLKERPSKRVYIEVYGCQMNVNDAEIVRAVLQQAGYVDVQTVTSADVVLLLTCALRERAEEKIWSRLEKLRLLKQSRQLNNGTTMRIGVLGCMAERLKEKIFQEQPAVDVVCGPDAYRDLPRLLYSVEESGQSAANVLLSLDETYADIFPARLNPAFSPTAYVSIMRGCDNMCSYCIVPFTRGRERSRPVGSILDEVRKHSDQGVKQVTLLGQNVNSYRDLSVQDVPLSRTTTLSSGFKTVYKPKMGGLRFADLLDRVSQIDPEMRVRFTSPHPKDFPDQVLQVIADRPNICNQIHMPAQAGNNFVLEQMGRGYTREAYLALVEHIRQYLKNNVALTSDFISGFCGETEAAHRETLDLIRQVRYHFVYCYPYSMREKTRAHRRFVDDVPADVKSRRHREVSDAFRAIAGEINAEQVGCVQLVLVEGASRRSSVDNPQLFGRNDFGTKVILSTVTVANGDNDGDGEISLRPGDYVVTRILSSTSQTLHGQPLYRTTLQSFSSKPFTEHFGSARRRACGE